MATTKPTAKSKDAAATTATAPLVSLSSRPFWHGIVYADPGTGKSHFLSTLPKPLDVASFDAVGKDTPYWLKGRGGEAVTEIQTSDKGYPFREVRDAKGKLLVRINYFHDATVDVPTAFSHYIDHLAWLAKRVEKGSIASHATDSISQAALLARKWSQYELKEGVKDPRQWYAEATDMLEEVLMAALPALPCHVGVACHIQRTKIEAEGSMFRSPLAPGRLGNNANLAAQWPEIYRVYVEAGENGKKRRLLQTEGDDKWIAATQINAPDPCRPTFEALWAGWDK